MSTTIHLQSSNGKIFRVDLEDVKCSGTIMALLKVRDEVGGGERDEQAIYLDGVNSECLKKVLEWTKHHKGDSNSAKEEGASGAAAVADDWDTAYLERQTPGDLFELVLAADNLKIEGLLNLTASKVVLMIKDKSAQEIRDTFGIKNDFTSEEYEKILKQNEEMFRRMELW